MTPTRCSRLRSCTRWDGTYRVTGSSRCACSSVRLQKGMLQHKRALACSIRPERASRGTMLAHSSCSPSPRRPVTWKVNTGWACHSATEWSSEEPIAVAAMACPAANQGHQEAQFALGLMLQQGTGGAKNEFAARRWLRQAAAGRDRELASQAAPIVDQLEKHLLYSGISGEQLLLGLGAALFVTAMAADAMGAEAAFRDDPSIP